MRLRLVGFVALASSLSCAPDISGQLWRCEAHRDCGAGYQCDPIQGHCAPALRDEQGVFSDHIVFGMSAALGDDVSLGRVGRAARVGLEAAFDHANRTGGVHGRRLELVAHDDSYDPVKTASIVTQMIAGPAPEVFALAGVIGTEPSLAARQVALQQRVIFFGPASGYDGLEPDPPDRYVFNLRPRYSEEAAQLTGYLLTRAKPDVPAQNIAVFAQGDAQGGLDALGSSAFAGVAQTLEHVAGIAEEQITVATYPASDTTAVASAAQALLSWMAQQGRKAGPTGTVEVGIVLVALHDAAAALIRAVEQGLGAARAGQAVGTAAPGSAEADRLRRVHPRFVSLSIVGEGLALALQSFGARADGVLYGAGTVIASPVPHFGSSASGVLRYREHLADHAPTEPPGFISLEAYLAGELLVEGLRQHGPDITTESLVDTLESLQVDLGIGPALGFSKSSHQAFNRLWGTRLDAKLEQESIGLLLQ